MVTGFDPNKNLKLKIDGSKVDKALQDYPILINLTSDSGINGYDCSEFFEEFSLLDGTFTGPDGEQPSGMINLGADDLLISNNRLGFDYTSGGSAKATASGVVNGDFEASVYYNFSSGTGNDSMASGLEVKDQTTGYIYYIGRICDGGGDQIKVRVWDPDYSVVNNVAYTGTDGFIRIRRVGTTIYLEYKTSSAANYTVFASRTSISTGDCDLSLFVTSPYTLLGYFDNLQVLCPNKKIALEYKGYPEYYEESADDDFTGADGDAPNSSLWQKVDSVDSTVDIQNNQLRLLAGGSDTVVKNDSVFILSGDFDIQLDIVDISEFDVSPEWFMFSVSSATDSTAYAFMAASYTASGKVFNDRIQAPGSSCCNDTSVARTNDYGQLRLSRVGTEITTKYKDGTGSWTTLRRGQAFCDHDVYVKMSLYIGAGIVGTTTTEAILDNFKINYADDVYWDTGYTPVQVLKQSPAVQQCKIEIERWSQSPKSVQLWAKIPEIGAGVDTTLYLFYDNTAADNTAYVGTIGESPAREVWSNSYRAVYHLSQELSSGNDLKESCYSTLIDGTASNIDLAHNVDGPVGKATYFNGGQVITISDNVRLRTVNNSMIEFVMYTLTDTNRRNPLDKAYGGEYTFTCETNGKLTGFYGTSGINSTPYSSLSATNADGGWHSLAMLRNFTGGAVYWYNNGVRTDSNVAQYDALTASTNDVRIGTGYSNPYIGTIRSIRISDDCRSPEWSKFIYYSDFDNAITYTKDVFTYTGYVTVNGVPAARAVHLYLRSTGELVDTAISSEVDGYFEVTASIDDYHFINILPDINDDYNLLSYDKIKP